MLPLLASLVPALAKGAGQVVGKIAQPGGLGGIFQKGGLKSIFQKGDGKIFNFAAGKENAIEQKAGTSQQSRGGSGLFSGVAIQAGAWYMQPTVIMAATALIAATFYFVTRKKTRRRR